MTSEITDLATHLREGVKNPDWAARMMRRHLEEIKDNPDDDDARLLAARFLKLIIDEYSLGEKM